MTNWQTKKLGDISTIKRGGSPRPIQDYLVSDKEDGYNWLKIGDVPIGNRYITKTSAKIKPAGLKKTTLVKKGEFILSNSMSFGRPYIMMIDACIHDGWLALQDINSATDKQFLYYLLTSEQMQNKFKNYSAGSGVQNLKKETVQDIDFAAPEKQEQERIVKVLEAWDEYIEKLEQKITLKEQLKKGLMQQLLTGKHRLFGFSDKWQEVTLGQLYKITSSKRVFEADWTHNGTPFYRAREVIKLRNEGRVDNELFITEKMFREYKETYGAVKQNDILVTGVGTIGIAYRVRDFTNFYFKDGNIIWLKDQGKVSSTFIEYLFESSVIRRQIHRLTPITTVATYTIEMANETKIKLPPRQEQDAISNILTSITKEISGLKQLKESAIQQKKYLLKNLIIGTIRTPENLKPYEVQS